MRIGRPFLALLFLVIFAGVVGAVVVGLAWLPAQTAWRVLLAASAGAGVGLAVAVIGRQLEVGGFGVTLLLIGGVALCGLAFPDRYDAYVLGLCLGAAIGLGGGALVNSLLARIEWLEIEDPRAIRPAIRRDGRRPTNDGRRAPIRPAAKTSRTSASRQHGGALNAAPASSSRHGC